LLTTCDAVISGVFAFLAVELLSEKSQRKRKVREESHFFPNTLLSDGISL